MEESILISMKKMLGLGGDCICDSFDEELINLINSVFTTLYQIGYEPAKNFRVTTPNDKWCEVCCGCDDCDILDLIKPYMYAKVRMLFDPPTSSFVLDSLKKQADELEWRIYIQSEGGFKTNAT